MPGPSIAIVVFTAFVVVQLAENIGLSSLWQSMLSGVTKLVIWGAGAAGAGAVVGAGAGAGLGAGAAPPVLVPALVPFPPPAAGASTAVVGRSATDVGASAGVAAPAVVPGPLEVAEALV